MTNSGKGRAFAAMLATALVTVLPAAAQAGEAHVENIGGVDVIVFTAAPGEVNSLLVDRNPGFTGDQYQLNDQDNPVSPGPGCQQVMRQPFNTPDPEQVRCGSSATTIQVNLGDGGDTVNVGDLSGNVITDVIDGGDGDDTLDASNGPGLIRGGIGKDKIDGNAGNDEILAGDGDDSIVAGPGSDAVNGEGGNDTILGHAKPDTQEIGTVTDFRAGDVNVLQGGSGNDTIVGDNGSDEILGDAGNDNLNGAGAADVLDGGAGNDRLDEGDTPGDASGNAPAGIAADTIRGGAGKDTATYCTRFYSESEAKKHPLTITLDNKGNDGEKGEKDNIGGTKGDVENVLGGGVTNDKITGNSKANELQGDCIVAVGRSGANRIYGGGGNDKLVGGHGKDLLNGGKGADGFIGNQDADTIEAKDGTRDKSINCDGFGVKSNKDKATVDRSDPSATNCDSVRR